MSFVICHLSFVICHLSFVIRHSSFVILAICHTRSWRSTLRHTRESSSKQAMLFIRFFRQMNHQQ
ncbi:hypothetical protein [Coleofasciculus sp. F4-SAH-05]|uniref:hypothetical protein n=1 Tax=Coleofasciculus sp. F4-SAH-05 TaxID=3069525 RepID=UPI0032FE26B6